MKDTVKVPWKAYILNAFCTVLIFVALSGMIEAKVIDKYIQGIIMLVFVNIILAVSLNLTTGFLGQIALGHAGFMSIGAYTSAIITKAVKDLPDGSFLQSLPPQLIFGVALLAGGILAALFGILVGIPALRLKGDYLAITPLALVRSSVSSWKILRSPEVHRVCAPSQVIPPNTLECATGLRFYPSSFCICWFVPVMDGRLWQSARMISLRKQWESRILIIK